MKKSLRNTKSLLSLLVVLLAALGLFATGCEEKKADTEEKEAEPAAEGAEEPAAEGTEAPAANEGADDEGTAGEQGAAAAGDETAAADAPLVHQPGAQIGDRTMCPVMGGEFEVTAESPAVEHEGKKVFFCCAGCDAKFQEDPAGKLAELKTKIDAANAE